MGQRPPTRGASKFGRVGWVMGQRPLSRVGQMDRSDVGKVTGSKAPGRVRS